MTKSIDGKRNCWCGRKATRLIRLIELPATIPARVEERCGLHGKPDVRKGIEVIKILE